MVDAATAAVTAASLDSSEDLIQIMPKIIEGSQGKLATVGLSNSSETIKVINVIGNSLVKSISGRSANLPSASAESGSTATETVLKKITSTSVANLDEAGLSSADIGNASSQLVETVVGSLGSGGLTSSELGGALDKITAGAVGSLDEITGFSVSSLGDAIDDITSGATAALGDITVTGYSADDLTTMVEKVTSGATSALGNISMTGYSSDNLSSMVEKVTSGATSALGKIEMTGYDSDDLSGMMEKVTAGATGALGNIAMDGYDASDLSGMVEKITSGATGALGNIAMDGYDSNDLSGMVSKITSGATGALGKIEMTGYSSDNITSMTSTITTSTTESLGNIKMEGFDKDNIPSDITNGITTGSNAGLLLQSPMVKEITAVTTPTKDNTPSYTFKSSKAGTITYGGSCTSDNTNATIGNNTITFSTLSDGTYSNCKLYVTSSTGVKGNALLVTSFTVDTSSGDSDSGSSDEAPKNVVFSKTILDPDAKRSWDYEESASDVIKTSGGDYVVVGTSISWEWPMPNNMDDILIVKLDGTSGNVIWNKKIHLRNFDRATSVVEDNDGNYVLTGFTSSNAMMD